MALNLSLSLERNSDPIVSDSAAGEKEYISDEQLLKLQHCYRDPVSGAWMPHPDYASALLLTREYQEAIHDDTNAAYYRLRKRHNEEHQEKMEYIERMEACEDPVEALKNFHAYTDEDVKRMHEGFDHELDISMANTDRSMDRPMRDRYTGSH
ncbi:hypothetical protein EVG20_g76 [Dentipellis fragilis]|uniref:Uncharacterized protein n=1 Tax=Dentipellis fragilis TaxID=205917 RepID=A0A4Y9ZEA2_9AGAM|nr:hypothetical protein EVG20_g76 [Dentipellis fragilis]